MIEIQTTSIENINKTTIININYPYISDRENLFKEINKTIYEDIMIFKEVVTEEIKNSSYHKNSLSYINTEYEITKSTDKLLSLYIEFSQLIGLCNINYINTYNYDLNLKREITIDDIFINKIKISSKLLDKDNIKFYIEDDGVVLCFSSYELEPNIEGISTIKIYFDEYVPYLSEYTLESLYK